MNNERKSIWLKRAAAYMVAAVVLMSGMAVKLVTVNAAEDQGDTVIYEEAQMSQYWFKKDKTAPVKDGYVFGGWYQDDEKGGKKAITEDEAENFRGTAYAKFVPAYVLSVKAQIEAKAELGDVDSTYLRLATSVDSLQYQNISFDVWVNNTVQIADVPMIKTVYDSVTTVDGTITPQEVFGEPAKKLATLKLANIPRGNYGTIIYVRPYWITLDGTRVEGLAKYLRVEDGFTANKYISVPINLLEQKQVAAGIVELSYADYKDTIEVAKDRSGKYLIDAGRVLPTMEYYVDEEKGIIRFVGNGTVGEYKTTEALYANVRFRVKNEAGVSVLERFLFKMQGEDFCDWTEKRVEAVNAWDYRYNVSE